MKTRLFMALVVTLALAACGHNPNDSTDSKTSSASSLYNRELNVRSRALIPLTLDQQKHAWTLSGNVPITVTNAPNTNMTIDVSKFKVPTITNAVLDFGTIAISSLIDNNLKVCGKAGAVKCTDALIIVYTTGVAGAGLWNATDGYGMPITATMANPLTVGLGPSQAALLEDLPIDPTKHVLRLSDFNPQIVVDIKSDFTNAGAGSYSTTLVIEYDLAPPVTSVN